MEGGREGEKEGGRGEGRREREKEGGRGREKRREGRGREEVRNRGRNQMMLTPSPPHCCLIRSS